MTQAKRRLYLIRELLKERPEYADIKIPEDEQEQKNMLRSLMNVRMPMPMPISRDFIRIQDEYLQTESNLRGIVDSDFLSPVPLNPNIILWQGDITDLKADAIVNAANCALRGCFIPLHSCIDNIVHSRSGVQLRILCDDIMNRQGHNEPTGKAKITPAFNLPSKYIIHTVGPIISGRVTKRDCDLLASCYRSCLELAEENECRSIAFCCISTGEFCFPNEPAAEIAVETVKSYLNTHSGIRVIFDVFKDKDMKIYQRLLEVNG